MSKIFLLIFLLGTLSSEDIYKQKHCIKNDKLIDIIKLDNVEKLKNTIGISCDLYNENKNGETLLFDAVKSNSRNVVIFLLNYGFDINHLNDEGQTVLHVAVKKKYENIVETLMKGGLNDSNDNYGYSAKWYAYKYNSLKSLEIIRIYEKMKDIKAHDSLDEFINNFSKNPTEEM